MGVSQTLRDWSDAGTRTRLLGHEIFTRVAATPGRPPLLLIHGYPTSSYDWHRLWAPLAEHHALYALDLLGFGSSSKPTDATYPISQQADLCARFLASHGIDRPHVLAHDYGDTVAQELLAREAEGALELASVCFLNGGLFPETHRARPLQKLLARPRLGPFVARAMNGDGFVRQMRAVSGEDPPDEQEWRDAWSLIEGKAGQRALARLIGYMEQRRTNRTRWVGALVNSTVPRRLVCGAADPVSGEHLAKRYRELVPAADVVLLPGVGHYPQLEQPLAVLDAYAEFRKRAG